MFKMINNFLNKSKTVVFLICNLNLVSEQKYFQKYFPVLKNIVESEQLWIQLNQLYRNRKRKDANYGCHRVQNNQHISMKITSYSIFLIRLPRRFQYKSAEHISIIVAYH